eukprot:2482682-Pyramimonas_sp.AAC.1
MALVPLFVERSGDRYSDSATATKLCNTPVQHQISSRHRYAGMRRGASLHEKQGHEYRVIHTPAHRSQA